MTTAVPAGLTVGVGDTEPGEAADVCGATGDAVAAVLLGMIDRVCDGDAVACESLGGGV